MNEVEELRNAAKVLRERVSAVQSGAAEPEMHPGVGLALADWLEATESTMRHVMDDLAAIEGQPTIDQLVGYDFVEAITVARLILGGS